MTTIHNIAKNTLSLFTAKVVEAFFGFLLAILIARMLGVSNYGQYSFVLALTAMAAIFTDLGYETLLVRDVARYKEKANSYLVNILVIRFFISLGVFIFLVAIVNALNFPTEMKYIVYLFSGNILLVSFARVFKCIYIAFERMEYYAYALVSVDIIGFSMSIVALSFGGGLITIGYIFLLKGLIDVGISFYICRHRFIRPKFEVDFNFFRTTILIALPMSITSFLTLMYVRLDTLMLTAMKGYDVVGWYNASYNLVLGLKPIPQLMMNVMLPIMAVNFIESKQLLGKIFEKTFKYLLIVGLPISFGIYFLAGKIIVFFYGQSYMSSVVLLQILTWDVVIMFLVQCMSYVLISMDKQNILVLTSGITVGFNFVLNLVLIPSYSSFGSGLATIICEFILLIICFYIVSAQLHTFRLVTVVIRPFIACGVMGVFLYVFHWLNLAVLIAGGAIVYFVTLYLIRGITKDETRMIRKMFLSRKKKDTSSR
jgi:O-antigen/teichoic acid export membrane protein